MIGFKIILKSKLNKGDTKTVRIYYQTSQIKTSLGLQWLTPAMTFGKKLPFVYTHAEAIHARSFYPCMDTPYVKFTVNASLTVNKDFVALFGGISLGDPIIKGDLKTYKYEQTVPIPSYLVAIAAGDLAYRSLGTRTGVWAEPSIVEAAKNEFDGTETFIATVSSIYLKFINNLG